LPLVKQSDRPVPSLTLLLYWASWDAKKQSNVYAKFVSEYYPVQEDGIKH